MARKAVIKKSGVRKRAPKSRSYWYNKKYSVRDLAMKAWQGVRAVRGIVNSEKKYRDTVITGNIDYNGAINNITDISQGDTTTTRNGNSILAKGLMVRYWCKPDVASPSATSQALLRVLIVQDTMNLGTTPTVSDVLEYTGSINGVLSPYKYVNANQYRFKVLYDKTHSLNGGSANHNNDVKIVVNDHIKYTGTAGTDEGRNQIYAIQISDQVTTNTPNFNGVFRISYYDN